MRAEEERRRHSHVTNQEITVRPSVRPSVHPSIHPSAINSAVPWSYHTKRGERGRELLPLLVLSFFLFPNVASLIDSLVTRGTITKNSEWLSIGRDQNHRDIPCSRKKRLEGQRDGSLLHCWHAGQKRQRGGKTYTSSWQHHALPTSWTASPYIRLY